MSDSTSFRPPLSVHEAAVERYFARDPRTSEILPDADLSTAASAMRTARQVAEQIASTADALHRDPTRTGPAVAVELRRTVPAVAERATVALDAAATRLNSAIRAVEEATAPKPPMTPEALQLAGETRAALKSMVPSDRVKALAAAIDGGDEATISAAVRGSAFLSGLEPGLHAALSGRWAAARHPVQAARAERLSHALAAVELAGGGLVGFATAIVSTPGAAAYEAAAGAADAALKAVRE